MQRYGYEGYPIVENGRVRGLLTRRAVDRALSHKLNLRAASLETLLQLVSAGFGCTLVPALAIRGAWMTDTGIVARRLELPDAFRRISLVFRRSFPRVQALEAFAGILLDHLPNTVRRLAKPGAPFPNAAVTTPALGDQPAPP